MNTFVFDQAMAHIEAHPEEWDQSIWANVPVWGTKTPYCGTSCCLAGRVLAQAGYLFVPPSNYNLTYNMARECVLPGEGKKQYFEIEEKAADVLEISHVEAQILFDADNTFEDLKEIGKEIVNGKIDTE